MKKLIAVGLALALAAVLGFVWLAQGVRASDLVQKVQNTPVVTRVQSALASSPSLIADMVKARRAQGDNVQFLFGTSELEQGCEDAAHPAHFFDEHDAGFSLMCIGNAGCQSLWQAMEIAALESEGALSGDRVVLLLGTQWFMGEGLTESAFAKRFSDETFAAVMANSKLTDETKQRIYDRCVAMGSDPKELDELKDTSLIANINRAISGLSSSLDKNQEILDFLNENAATIIDSGDKEPLPNWEELDELVEAQGEASCTNNDLGILNEYYTDVFLKQDQKNRESKGSQKSGWNQDEFSDFQLFLDICRDLGIKPLIIIQPAMGVYYDNTPYDKESRQLFYDKVREMVDAAGGECLDLSGHEYEKYYMRDVMHPEWRSWVIVDQKLCDIYGNESS